MMLKVPLVVWSAFMLGFKAFLVFWCAYFLGVAIARVLGGQIVIIGLRETDRRRFL